tara:strand:+ start:186 stop:575 length:390 start_codon:yes stop_codon:yes gene_type:complete
MNEFKIYYEDTDASGRVYHANYLKYLERSRSNFIYQSKYNHTILLKKYKIIFVVKNCNIEFIKPAFFEDTIKVISTIKELSKVKINFSQKIFRENELLLNANVLVIPIDTYGKIVKLPDELISFLEKLN